MHRLHSIIIVLSFYWATNGEKQKVNQGKKLKSNLKSSYLKSTLPYTEYLHAAWIFIY